VLCHRFRHEEDLQERFFREVRHGPQAAPARDPVWELVVAMRKKNLSVYDIQYELKAQNHEISINALSSMVGLKVDFDLQLTLMASSLYRLFARYLPENYRQATAKVLFDSLLDVAGTVEIDTHRIIVILDKRGHNPYLVDSGLAKQPTSMPWLDGKSLVIEFS
jgi:hypothetical protein